MAATEELGLEVFVEGWQKFEKILDKLDKKIDDTGDSMTTTGKIAGGAFAVALGNVAFKAVSLLAEGLVKAGKAVIAFGADSIQMAADFQSQMAILEIAAGSTGLTFDELHDAALAVGGDITLMGVSATGAADAMTGLFKAGLSNVEVFGDLEGFMAGTAELGGALRASIDLAAASELDMVQASDLAAIALASFGSELVTETERAEFINDAMNNMVQAADASVAEVSDLAQALMMVGPAAGAAGISIQDTNNALALLSTRGIAGSRAGTALDAMLRSLTDATPQATDMLEKLGVEVFDLDGNMNSIVDIVGDFETAIGDATDAERENALGTVFTAQGKRAMNALLISGVEGWNDMAEATANAAGIQEQAAARSQTFNAQMEALEGTIETLKIGIGEQFLPIAQELATWFAEMVDQHGPELQAIFETIAGAISDIITFFMELLATEDPLNEFFTLLPEPIQAFIDFMVDDFVPAMQEVWAFVMEQVADVVAWYEENLPLIEATGQALADFWNFVIVPALDNAWNIIKEIVGTAIEVILGIITLAMQIITGDWEGAWNTIQTILVDVTEAILNITEEVMEATANAMGTSMEEIRATWASNWEMLKIIVVNVLNEASTAVGQALLIIKFKIVDTLNKAATAARQLVPVFRQVGADLIRGMAAGILSKIGDLISAAAKAVRDALGAARAALGARSPSTEGIALGEDFDRGVAIGLAKLAPMVQAQMSAVVQAPAVARRGGGDISNQVTNEFNLTTQSLVRPGGLALEFQTMSFASR